MVDETQEVLEAMNEERGSGRSFVLATVIHTSGSVPRGPGAKMLVRAEGGIAGTVGGGPLEAMAIAAAVELLRQGGSSRKQSFELKHEGVDSLKMRCGGQVEIFFDVHRPPASIVIIGGGHVGRATAALSVAAGIPTVVVDDRPEFSGSERFPGAKVMQKELRGKAPLSEVPIGPGDALVIVTRCHDVDQAVLRAALETPAAYIGMIGSLRKVTEIFEQLANDGKDPGSDSRVHAPIGLALGSDAPGEIAVSILAEILKVRSGGDASPLRERLPKRRRAKSAGGSRG